MYCVFSSPLHIITQLSWVLYIENSVVGDMPGLKEFSPAGLQLHNVKFSLTSVLATCLDRLRILLRGGHQRYAEEQDCAGGYGWAACLEALQARWPDLALTWPLSLTLT
jgi:hypothetical protein